MCCFGVRGPLLAQCTVQHTVLSEAEVDFDLYIFSRHKAGAAPLLRLFYWLTKPEWTYRFTRPVLSRLNSFILSSTLFKSYNSKKINQWVSRIGWVEQRNYRPGLGGRGDRAVWYRQVPNTPPSPTPSSPQPPGLAQFCTPTPTSPHRATWPLGLSYQQNNRKGEGPRVMQILTSWLNIYIPFPAVERKIGTQAVKGERWQPGSSKQLRNNYLCSKITYCGGRKVYS